MSLQAVSFWSRQVARRNGCLPVSCCMASLGGITEGLSIPKERDVLSRDFWRFLYMRPQLLFFDVVGSNGHIRRRFSGATGKGVTKNLRICEGTPGFKRRILWWEGMEPEPRHRYR